MLFLTTLDKFNASNTTFHTDAEVRTPAERHAAMTWAQRLKRVFSAAASTAIGHLKKHFDVASHGQSTFDVWRAFIIDSTA